MAQTIGGGGGRAGGGAASNSGTIGVGVAVGATGGNGGDTYYQGSDSSVTNSGTIVTFGADAGGILAQSIGGGGGVGGTAGTTMGSSTSNNDGSNGTDVSTEATVTGIVKTVNGDFQGTLSVYNNLSTLVSTANNLIGNSDSRNDNSSNTWTPLRPRMARSTPATSRPAIPSRSRWAAQVARAVQVAS